MLLSYQYYGCAKTVFYYSGCAKTLLIFSGGFLPAMLYCGLKTRAWLFYFLEILVLPGDQMLLSLSHRFSWVWYYPFSNYASHGGLLSPLIFFDE
jgi:hypothetical protein